MASEILNTEVFHCPVNNRPVLRLVYRDQGRQHSTHHEFLLTRSRLLEMGAAIAAIDLDMKREVQT